MADPQVSQGRDIEGQDGLIRKGQIPAHQLRMYEKVMAYRHQPLIREMVRRLGLDERSALELFEDSKKFLFLRGVHILHKKRKFLPPPDIRKGIEVFMLFSGPFHNFCYETAGVLLHFEPLSAEEQAATRPIVDSTIELAEEYFAPLSGNWRADPDITSTSSHG